jgi:aspartate ammonia-lyase
VQLETAVSELKRVNLGGTIVGRSTDVPVEYFKKVLGNLDAIFPSSEIRRSSNLYDAAQNLDDLVAVSGRLELVARSLIKICKDLRLLGSGPEGGLGEINLPSVQPGSSIMPGKVNPVIPEFVIQVCFRIIGNHHMCSMAIDHGELDLNVWESPVVFGILESMDLLETALCSFCQKCLSEMTAPDSPNSKRVESLIAKLTELSKVQGYSKISNVCKKAGGDFSLIRELLRKEGFDA